MKALRWILLAVAISIAAGVVFSAFNPAPHTGGDNAGYVTLAYSLLKHHTYTELFDPARPPHTKYPPVFPALLAGLMLLGARSWVALKGVAALSTVAAVGLTYLWAERRMNAVWALGVALATALASSVVYYSHWILSDPTFLAFTLLALVSLELADSDGAGSAGGDGGRTIPLAIGIAAAGLAYFTRSAGLPLVVVLLAWLALRRRWRALAASAVALGIPIGLWILRARGATTAGYVSEFWLVDPYDPSRGRVGLGGLIQRVIDNLVGYVGTHGPGGIVGAHGPATVALGVALTALGLAGWALTVRRRVGPAELFFPLYAGLILAWPVVWSGDRFALPLYPLLFVYAAHALRTASSRLGHAAPPIVGALALVAILLPEAKAFARASQDSSACASVVRLHGPWACYGSGVTSFVDAAGWAGAHLPEGSAVLTRKPRIFYVLSGVPSRTFPFLERADAHIALADSLGARYELLDAWDGLAGRYVVAAVRERPGAYCALQGFGQGGQLLGFLPPDERDTASAMDADGSVRIVPCGNAYVAPGDSGAYSSSAAEIPLLRGLDPGA